MLFCRLSLLKRKKLPKKSALMRRSASGSRACAYALQTTRSKVAGFFRSSRQHTLRVRLLHAEKLAETPLEFAHAVRYVGVDDRFRYKQHINAAEEKKKLGNEVGNNFL